MAESYRSFGSYILFKEILKDGMGSIYRAGEFDAGGIRRNVWFRLFDTQEIPKEDVTSSFDQARQIMEHLQAGNVVSGADFIIEDGVPAMAFDYLAGQPLSLLFDKVRNEGFPVAVDNALLIMEKISLGLASGLVVDVGGRPLIHGMLHPSMVFVTNDGEGVVSGFGMAESLLGLLDTPVASEIKPYLAPEVLMNRTPGKRSDVYSLGAILFQLLTGSPLPENPEEREGILDRAEMSYDGDAIPDDIKVLLGRCLSPKMEDRFSSASDFKKELDKLLYGGNYSPTTFNLALFMDRLFRDEIEKTGKERAIEAEVDVEPYLKPEPEPEEEVPAQASGGGKSLYIVIAAALVLLAVGLLFVMNRPPAVPTPTPEEIAVQKAEQEKRIKELAAQIAEERLKEAEEKISSELEQRQKKIEELQKQLAKGQTTTSSAANTKRQAEIQKQLEAEKEQQRQQQEKLRKEKERVLEQSRKEAEARAKKEAAREAAAKAAAKAAAEKEASATKNNTETAPVNTPEESTNQAPTEAASIVKIEENQLIPATEVDSAPATLKEEPVKWPRMSRRSRHKKGMVIVEALVNARGRVESVKILRADDTGGGIPEAVMDAVKKYVFKPGMKNGVKIKTTVTVVKQYNFR